MNFSIKRHKGFWNPEKQYKSPLHSTSNPSSVWIKRAGQSASQQAAFSGCEPEEKNNVLWNNITKKINTRNMFPVKFTMGKWGFMAGMFVELCMVDFQWLGLRAHFNEQIRVKSCFVVNPHLQRFDSLSTYCVLLFNSFCFAQIFSLPSSWIEIIWHWASNAKPALGSSCPSFFFWTLIDL